MSGHIEITHADRVRKAMPELPDHAPAAYEILSRDLFLPDALELAIAPSGHQSGLVDISLFYTGNGKHSMPWKGPCHDFETNLTLDPKAGIIELDWIFVSPELRGKKLGDILTRNVIDFASISGCRKVKLRACCEHETQVLDGSYFFARYFVPDKSHWQSMRLALLETVPAQHCRAPEIRGILTTKNPINIWKLTEIHDVFSDDCPVPIGKYLLTTAMREQMSEWKGFFDLSNSDQRRRFHHVTGLSFDQSQSCGKNMLGNYKFQPGL